MENITLKFVGGIRIHAVYIFPGPRQYRWGGESKLLPGASPGRRMGEP